MVNMCMSNSKKSWRRSGYISSKRLPKNAVVDAANILSCNHAYIPPPIPLQPSRVNPDKFRRQLIHTPPLHQIIQIDLLLHLHRRNARLRIRPLVKPKKLDRLGSIDPEPAFTDLLAEGIVRQTAGFEELGDGVGGEEEVGFPAAEEEGTSAGAAGVGLEEGAEVLAGARGEEGQGVAEPGEGVGDLRRGGSDHGAFFRGQEGEGAVVALGRVEPDGGEQGEDEEAGDEDVEGQGREVGGDLAEKGKHR